MKTSMPQRTPSLIVGGILCAALFAFAFVAAPKSCEWGLTAYFWSGVTCVLALFALPLVLRAAPSTRDSIGLAFAFAAAGCGAWIAGLFVANVQIMCRLF
jgi:hypothetical protein